MRGAVEAEHQAEGIVTEVIAFRLMRGRAEAADDVFGGIIGVYAVGKCAGVDGSLWEGAALFAADLQDHPADAVLAVQQAEGTMFIVLEAAGIEFCVLAEMIAFGECFDGGESMGWLRSFWKSFQAGWAAGANAARSLSMALAASPFN